MVSTHETRPAEPASNSTSKPAFTISNATAVLSTVYAQRTQWNLPMDPARPRALFATQMSVRRLGDPIDLSWARRFAHWASYALAQQPPESGVGRNAFAHESGIHADGAQAA